MVLEGIVTNVTAFGAFVDIGVHQDGLVHVSELSDRFVRDPAEVVKAGDKLKVTVVSVDLDRKRIALSAKTTPGAARDAAGGRRGAGQQHDGGRPARAPRRGGGHHPAQWLQRNPLPTLSEEHV